ncbi:hypothetical protein HY504_00555 [Candidatus Wolfebacteria bacterium]|nr:hypothetical protein [Candidatus Wolfebacteria bacterium]
MTEDQDFGNALNKAEEDAQRGIAERVRQARARRAAGAPPPVAHPEPVEGPPAVHPEPVEGPAPVAGTPDREEEYERSLNDCWRGYFDAVFALTSAINRRTNHMGRREAAPDEMKEEINRDQEAKILWEKNIRHLFSRYGKSDRDAERFLIEISEKAVDQANRTVLLSRSADESVDRGVTHRVPRPRVNLGGKGWPKKPSFFEKVFPTVAQRRAERRARTEAELEAERRRVKEESEEEKRRVAAERAAAEAAEKEIRRKEREEELKKKYDPVRAKLRELGFDADKINPEYWAIVSIEADKDDLTKRSGTKQVFRSYHDFLAWLQGLTPEERSAFIGTRWMNKVVGEWENPTLIAYDKFWTRIWDPEDPLHEHKDEIQAVINAALKGELPDEYATAVVRRELDEPDAAAMTEAPPPAAGEPLPPEATRDEDRRREEVEVEHPAETPELAASHRELLLARAGYVVQYRAYHERRTGRISAIKRSIFGERTKTEELSLEFCTAKERYDAAKKAHCKELYEAKRKELAPVGGRLTPEQMEALAVYRLKLFDTLVVQEREKIYQDQIESYPPRERALPLKLLDWYGRRNKWGRLVATSLIMTGAFAMMPGVGLTAVAGYGAWRVTRGALSMLAAQGFGKCIDWGLALETRRIKEEKMNDLRFSFLTEYLDEAEEQYENILKRERRNQRLAILIKGSAMAATGMLGAGLLEHFYGPRFTVAGTARPAAPGAHPPETAAPRAAAPAEAPRAAVPRPEAPTARVAAPVPAETPKAPAVAEPVEPLARVETPTGKPSVQDVRPPVPSGLVEEPTTQDPFVSLDEKTAELATVQKGEGIWHAVRRQLMERAKANPGDFGLDPDDFTNNKAKVDIILERKTANLLTEQGFMDGQEVRIAKPGVKVLLGDDGKIHIEGGRQFTYEVDRGTVEGRRVELPERGEDFPTQVERPRTTADIVLSPDAESLQPPRESSALPERDIDAALPYVKDIFDTTDGGENVSTRLAELQALLQRFANQGEILTVDAVRKSIEEFSGSTMAAFRDIDDPHILWRYATISEQLGEKFGAASEEGVRAGAGAFRQLGEFLRERGDIVSALHVTKYVFGATEGLGATTPQFAELVGYFADHGEKITEQELYETVNRLSSTKASVLEQMDDRLFLRRFSRIGDYLKESQKATKAGPVFELMAEFLKKQLVRFP